jgi:hypothetical protein
MADGLKLPTSGDFAKHKNFIASRKGRAHGTVAFSATTAFRFIARLAALAPRLSPTASAQPHKSRDAPWA